MAPQTQQLTVAIKLNDQFSKGMGEIEKKVNITFSDNENKKGSLLSGVKKSTVAMVGLATVGLGAVAKGLTSSFNSAKQFEQSMADVGAITGATGQTFDDLSNLAREMGATTSFSATQAAEGIQFLGMAGLGTDEIMTALPASLQLASAGSLSLGEAADISTNIMGAMRLEADDLGRVVDVLAQSARKSNTDVQQMGEGMKYVAPTAAALKVPLEDTASMLGILASNGLQASVGGTSLNAAFRAMVAPSGEAEKAAKKLGLTFVDAEGKMLPMTDILTQLDDNAVSVKDQFELFGSEGARAIGILRGAGVEAFTEMNTAMLNAGGTAEDMAKTKLGTFEGSMKLLSSAVEEFQISVGNQLLPAATSILNDFLIPVINKTNEFISGIGGFPALFEGLFNVVKGFGETWFNLVKNVLTDFSFAKDYYTNWANIFGRVITIAKNALVGPTGRGGLVGIWDEVANIMFVPLEKAFLAVWDFVKQPVIDGMNFVSKAVVDGANSIINEFNAVGQHIGLTIDKIDFSPITVEPAKTFKEHWEDGENAVSQGLANIGKIANDMGTQLKDDTDDLFVAVEAQGELVGSVMSDTMKKGLDTLKGVNKEIVKETKDTGDKAGDNLGKGIKKGIEKNAPTPKFLEDKIALGKNLLGSFEKNFGDSNKGIGGVLGGAFKAGLSGGSFKDIIGQAATQIGTMLAGPIGGLVAGGLTKVFSGIFSKGSKAKRAMARADTNIGQLEDIFARTGGDFGFASAEDVQALEGYNTRGLKDDPTGWAMVRELVTKEGFSSRNAELLVFNILPKLAKGHKLPAKELRFVNQAFRNLSVRRKAGELIEEQRVEDYEESIEADAEALNLKLAAGGYNGMVGKPTMFLAGEAGPEHVSITPSSRMNGGFVGGGGGNNHFSFQVSAIDAKGVKEFIENDAKEFMLNILQRESQRGRAVVYNTGVVTDPSV
tara:strand:- start:587 stop:3424 length:2838 start_codon:yes stop_codon:yes gene_type:complete